MNIRRMAVSLLAAAGLAVALAGGASAQQPGGGIQGEAWEEFSCVYTSLMVLDDEPYFAIVDSYISQLTEGDEYEAAIEVILPALEECAAQYDWTAEQGEAAMTMGVAGVVADAIEGYLVDVEGFTNEDIDNIIALIDTMSDEEVFTLADGQWRGDKEFIAVIAGHLAGIGIEGDDALISDCATLLETYVIGMFQTDAWMDMEES